MTSLYPKARDAGRRINAPADEVHAQLFRDMFDSIIAVEQELGVNPSGQWGSIYGRLFASELVSKTCGYWRKISTKIHPTYDDWLRGSFDFATIATWQPGRMDGTDTAMGEDTPFVFTVYQGRAQGGSFFIPSPGRAYGQPWYCYPFVVKKDRVWIAGVGADQVAPGTHVSCEIGVIAWGLQPSPVQRFEQE